MTSVIQIVEAEDIARGLYALQVAPASLLEYPKFAGCDTQCYFTFEEKVIHCLKSNKVPRVDQTAKLREQLSGHPLVPESIKNIEDPFSALRSRYGDEERVLNLRVSALKKLGSVPEKFKDQVTFFIDLESKIQDILSLGAKGERLGRLAYGQSSTQSTTWSWLASI